MTNWCGSVLRATSRSSRRVAAARSAPAVEVGLEEAEAGLERRHEERGPDPLAHDVGHGHEEPAARQRGGLVGVARDVAAGPPADGDLEAGHVGERGREQAPLDLAREPDLLPEPLALDALGHALGRLERADGEGGERGGEVGRVGVERARRAGPEEGHAARDVAGPERDGPLPPGLGQVGAGVERARPVEVGEGARDVRGGLGPAPERDGVVGLAAVVRVAQGDGEPGDEELAHEGEPEPVQDRLAVERAPERLRELEQRPELLGPGPLAAVGLGERGGRPAGPDRGGRGPGQRPGEADLGRRVRPARRPGPERDEPDGLAPVRERDGQRQPGRAERRREAAVHACRQPVARPQRDGPLDRHDAEPGPVGEGADAARGEEPAHQREQERAELVGRVERGVEVLVGRGGGVHRRKLADPCAGGSSARWRRSSPARRDVPPGRLYRPPTHRRTAYGSRWITSASRICPSSTVSRTHVLTWWNPCRPAAPGLR